MATFDEVHRKDLRAADGRLRIGEMWRVAVREPLEAVSLAGAIADARVTIVQFVATSDGKLEPATKDDHAILEDWKRRHRDTPIGRFELPAELAQRF